MEVGRQREAGIVSNRCDVVLILTDGPTSWSIGQYQTTYHPFLTDILRQKETY